MPRFYLVDLESITCDESRSQFAIEQLEGLASSIAEMGSLVKPIILEATSRQTYKLLSGALEYYAAVRASEINPEIEMVDAFVVEPEELEMTQKQLKILLPPVSPPVISSSLVTDRESNVELERRLNNIELRLDQSLQEVKSDYTRQLQTLKKEIQDLEQSLPHQSEPLEMFNTLSEPELARAIRKAIPGDKIPQTIAANLIKARTEAPFTSYSDVVNRTIQLADKRMLIILDAWSGFR